MSSRFSTPLWLGLVLSAVVAAHAKGQDNRVPVPDAAAQKAGLQLVTEVFREEYAEADTADEKKKLARQMLETADKTTQDVAARYVLLRVARAISVQAADVEAALEAMDSIDRWYRVDGFALKLDLLSRLVGSTRTRSQRVSLFARLGPFYEEALRTEKYESALKIAAIETDLAGQLRDARSRITAQSHRQAAEQLQKPYIEVQQAYTRLNEDPADPAANLTIGKYLCFERDDWENGLAALALCGDESLRKAATRDLAGAESLPDQLQLADGWWEAAKAREGDAKTGCLLRAGVWYEKAQTHGPKGLTKVKIEKRLAEVPKVGQPDKPTIPKSPKEVTIDLPGGVKMNFVLIPAGEFLMGSSDAERRLALELEKARKGGTTSNGIPSEGPQHRVKISRPFYLGKYEVTQAQRAAVMGNNPSHFKHPSHPVEMVSWNDATEFCRKLSERDGRTYRLWQMSGNAWEWCADWYASDVYERYGRGDLSSPASGSLRVICAGSWFDSRAGYYRCAYRKGYEPAPRNHGIGFRVAASLPLVPSRSTIIQPAANGPAAEPKRGGRLHRAAIPPTAAEFNGHRYFLFTASQTPNDAETYCNGLGGYLVRIQSAEEQRFVERLLVGIKAGQVWIGGSDQTVEGKWIFSDGSNMPYTNWAPRSPNDRGNEDFACILCDAPGDLRAKWDDKKGGGPKPFICEWGD